MVFRIISITILAMCSIVAYAQPTSNQVTNADIVKMLKAGVDQRIVTWVIENSNGKMLDGSPSVLQVLKSAGGSQATLDALAAKSKKAHAALAGAVARRAHPEKVTHGASATAAFRNPSTSARAAKQVESLQAETCEDTLETVDDCHPNHKTGCSHGENPRYDAYLNYLKNGLPDPASTASPDVNGGNPIGPDFFASLESGISDTLTSTNHAQHAVDLSRMG